MKVVPVPGEATRYWVESNSLQCPACHRLFSRLDPKCAGLRVDSKCPRCHSPRPRPAPAPGDALLQSRYHLVDVACFWPVGQCSCEHFEYRLKPEVEKLTPAGLRGLGQRQAAALRCSHIEAARTAALDKTIHAHEAERLAAGRGRTEEASP